MARAVIKTGRSRVRPDTSAASTASTRSSMRASLAKLTKRMLFDAAMPTAMMDPMNDSTLSVVLVKSIIHKIPEKAPGTASMMRRGSIQDW